jgi:putative MFS transporter
MAAAVNAGARLDRLPISSFHYRIFWLVGAGMFFDGYDLYVASGVLAATIQTKFSTLPQNLQFISLTFVGMTIGALITGFVGDWLGRRFTYQINLLIFGLASLAAAFAQDMDQLIAWRSWWSPDFPSPHCCPTSSFLPSDGARCSSSPASAH